MSEIRELARMMRELEDQVVVCMRCGMCQAVCPVYKQTGKEADVARGKLALVDSLMEEMLSDVDGVRERLQKCLLCGSCAANCPSGVELADIFLKARTVLTKYAGLSSVKRVIFRGLLSRPKLFDNLLALASKIQGVVTRSANVDMGTSCARIGGQLIGDRHFKKLAEKPFHKTLPHYTSTSGKTGLKVAVFTGCVIDKVFPEVALSTLKVLEHHGVGVFLPEGQGCCGIPAIASGDAVTLSKLARHNLELYRKEKFDVLLTACGTCTATIKEIWPEMVTGLSQAEERYLTELAKKTCDVSEFLVNRLGVKCETTGKKHLNRKVSYHDPCHLKKSLGVFREPRELIATTQEYELAEMDGADTCCGMGGSFNVQYYDISCDIGTLKRDSIVKTECDVVSTGCPACMMHIADMLSRHGDNIQVRHYIELYAESLN